MQRAVLVLALLLLAAGCARNPAPAAVRLDPYGRVPVVPLLGGHVLTDDGWPIVNARVAFLPGTWPPTERRIVRTTRDGRFYVRELTEGPWTVDVTCPEGCTAAGPQPAAPHERFQPVRADFTLLNRHLPILTFVLPTLRHPLAVMLGDPAVDGQDLELIDRLAADVLYATEDARFEDALLPSGALLARLPELAAFWRPVARAHLAAGRTRLAMEAYDRYLAVRPEDAAAGFERARARMAEGILDPADLAMLQRAADAGEAPPEDLYNLGQVAFARDDPDTARYWFERALSARPGWVPVVFQLGMVEMNVGNYPEACRHLQDVVILDPNGSAGQDARLNLEYMPCD